MNSIQFPIGLYSKEQDRVLYAIFRIWLMAKNVYKYYSSTSLRSVSFIKL